MTFDSDQGSNSGSVLKKLQKLSFEVDLALKQKKNWVEEQAFEI